MPANRLYLIINNRHEITADTALRLGHYFHSGPELWLYVQMKYNLKLEEQKLEKDKLSLKTLELSHDY